MQIAGIQKLTLVDFPGHVAATVFTRGCSFRCPFCHNPELVLPEQFIPLLSEREIFDFLESRYGKLSGICITGGEPLMQEDISKFISHIKALGFDVKLDTNGSYPDKLTEIIKEGDVDYIAMDIKNSLNRYSLTVFGRSREKGVESKRHLTPDAKLQTTIEKSIELIMSSGIPYEFRTTVVHPLHEMADFEQMGEMIKGAKKYCLQNFVQSKHIDSSYNFIPFTDPELNEAKKIMEKYVEKVEIR